MQSALRARLASIGPGWILLAAWVITIAYAYPGYMNWDAGDQLYSSRRGVLDDWHPPMMAAYWHLIEHAFRGPFGMLLVQTALFLWGLYAAFRLRFSPRRAAVLAAALMLFPPILTPMAVVWKDAQMAAFLLAGTMLALRSSWWARGAGLMLLVLAAGVRDNGAAALPPLCVLFVASWQLVRRRVAQVAIAAGIFFVVVAVAMTANKQLTDKRQYAWYKSVAIHDLAGAICREDPMTDEQVRDLLTGVPILQESSLQDRICYAYDSRVWFMLTFGGPEKNIFTQRPDKPERLARKRAWTRVVREHTHAYLSHRWDLMRQVLGLGDSVIWEPVCQTFAANPDHLKRVHHNASLSWLQKRLGGFFREKLGQSMLYRPWVYLLIGIVLFAYAVKRRDGLLCALIGSGLLYEASLFIGAAAPDFRYSHWMVVCVCFAAVTVFLERLKKT